MARNGEISGSDSLYLFLLSEFSKAMKIPISLGDVVLPLDCSEHAQIMQPSCILPFSYSEHLLDSQLQSKTL